MQLTFLGGAREIGASSCVLEAEGKRIMIDAGIRPSPQEGQSFLPKFGRAGNLDLVLLTHAHTDHVGALPVLLRQHPNVPVVTTQGTFEVMKLVLPINQYVMEVARDTHERAKEAAYTDVELDKALGAVLLTDQEQWFKPFPDSQIKVGFFGAGHIMGASVIAIEAEGRRLLFSGDFCIRDQRSQPGFRRFDWEPDLVVTEATYALQEHPPRQEEEGAFLETLESVFARDGIVLIPAFAVGRAQEILLTLGQAMISGNLRRVPIYYDGLVSRVLDLYENLGHFEIDPRVPIERVSSNGERFAALRNAPAVIVASSGNLAGGASVFYAQRILPNSKHAVLFSGYQDEEAPGRILLALQAGGAITLDKKQVRLRAEIRRYQFSAHADTGELQGFVDSWNPKVVVLNHGDWKRMQGLAEKLRKHRVVWMPSTRIIFDPFTTDLDQYMRLGELQAGRSVQAEVRKGWLTKKESRRSRVAVLQELSDEGAPRKARKEFDLDAFLDRLSELETRLGYTFDDPKLLVQALTHRSFLNEYPGFEGNHNEQLEFLGDAVLEYLVTKELMRRFPGKHEGELTGLRSALVNATRCRLLAEELGVEPYLLLSRGGAKDKKGKARIFMLANAFEALIAAIHEDGGLEACEKFVSATTFSKLDEVVRLGLDQDPKNVFQERVQAEGKCTPEYHVQKEWGPANAPNFIVGVFVDGHCVAEGRGSSKQEAQVWAAHKALEKVYGVVLPDPRLFRGKK